MFINVLIIQAGILIEFTNLLYSGLYHVTTGLVEVWKTLCLLSTGEAETKAEREAER